MPSGGRRFLTLKQKNTYMKPSLKLAGLLAVATATTALADVKLNENFTTSGYLAGSYRYVDRDLGDSSDKFDLDAAKLLFSGSFKPVTGVLSFYYQPNAPQDVTVLDAYATYDAGGGVSVTAGKFLSYLGYEAFDIPNMSQITYANGDFLMPIPGYHSGVKVDYADETFGAGAALLDSVGSPYYLRGDGELKHNAGFEGYLTYKGVKDLTLWGGIAYDTKGNFNAHSKVTYDFWASYVMGASTFAGELAYSDAGFGAKGYNWLALYSYAFDGAFSTAFRVSGEKIKEDAGYVKYTVAPSYKLSENLYVRAEVSYQDYSKYSENHALFFGVQTFFKF